MYCNVPETSYYDNYDSESVQQSHSITEVKGPEPN